MCSTRNDRPSRQKDSFDQQPKVSVSSPGVQVEENTVNNYQIMRKILSESLHSVVVAFATVGVGRGTAR
jgi:hypothetical protein